MMKTTTEMQLVAVAKLVPYVNNARTHSPEQINKLRSSLREFGFINPVIIDRDFGVIAGHGRILAAKEEGITEVPCVFADHLTEAQKKAYIIADNRMAMDAGWDEELLRVEIEALQAEDFDLALTGFDEKELSKLFDDGTEGKEDDFDVTAELVTAKTDNTRLGAYSATRKLLEEYPETDGIVYSDDVLATVGVHALRELKRKIPEEVAVIGINNSFYAELSTPQLTSLDNMLYDQSLTVVRTLLDLLTGNHVNRQVMICSEIVERETT